MKTLTFILLAISLNTLGQDVFLFGDNSQFTGTIYKDPAVMWGTASIATTFTVNYKLIRTDEFANMSQADKQQATLKNYAIGAAVTIGGILVIESIQKSEILKSNRSKRYKKHKSTLKFR